MYIHMYMGHNEFDMVESTIRRKFINLESVEAPESSFTSTSKCSYFGGTCGVPFVKDSL